MTSVFNNWFFYLIKTLPLFQGFFFFSNSKTLTPVRPTKQKPSSVSYFINLQMTRGCQMQEKRDWSLMSCEGSGLGWYIFHILIMWSHGNMNHAHASWGVLQFIWGVRTQNCSHLDIFHFCHFFITTQRIKSLLCSTTKKDRIKSLQIPF